VSFRLACQCMGLVDWLIRDDVRLAMRDVRPPFFKKL
jgi:hypothetical protein